MRPKNLEQAKARYEAERRKQNEKRRKAENHHKYMMGGIIVKYFPECYQYEQNELDGILRDALSSPQFQKAVELVQKVNAQEYDIGPGRRGLPRNRTKLLREEAVPPAEGINLPCCRRSMSVRQGSGHRKNRRRKEDRQ